MRVIFILHSPYVVFVSVTHTGTRGFGMILCRTVLIAAVNFITEDGMTYTRHMHADLMRSARFELAFDKRNTVKTLGDTPMRDRLARSSVADYRHPLAVNGMTPDGSIHSSRILAGRADADSHITSIRRVKRDLLGKRTVRGIVLGNNEKS
jgi:hypothetical protein